MGLFVIIHPYTCFAVDVKVQKLQWSAASVHTTYHVVAASVFLNADIALRTL